MPTAKVAITIDRNLLARLDAWVADQGIPSRSRAVEQAIQEKLHRLSRDRLARECNKLDIEFERRMADIGITEDLDIA